MIKKRKTEKKINYNANVLAVLAVLAIIIAGALILKKPSTTGFAVLTQEKTYDDNLGLSVNGSTNYTWNLRNPGILQSIKASGMVSKNGSAKVYVERGGEKVLIFDSTKPLFDVNIQVLPEYKKLIQGDKLLLQIILFNLKGFGKFDVSVQYSIVDENGDVVAIEEENTTVETQTKFVRELVMPSDIKTGAYTAFVEVKKEEGLVGIGSDLFEVVGKEEKVYPKGFKYYVSGFVVLLAVIFIAAFSSYGYRKLKKKKQITEMKEKVPQEKMQKLENELKALENAYKSGFISEESYLKEKQRIEGKIKSSQK